MPVTYTFSADRRTIHTRCAGLVTVQQIVEHFRSLERDPICPSQLDVFLDLSELEVTSIPHSRDLSGIVLEVKRIEKRVRFGACAIFAPGEAIFGMMRMFEIMADTQFRTIRIFRDPTEAQSWLACEQSRGEKRGARAVDFGRSAS